MFLSVIAALLVALTWAIWLYRYEHRLHANGWERFFMRRTDGVCVACSVDNNDKMSCVPATCPY